MAREPRTSGPAPVAIRASHDALPNFQLDRPKRRRRVLQLADVRAFRSDHVIEFEYDDVRDSAVDTWMLSKIRCHPGAIHRSLTSSALSEYARERFLLLRVTRRVVLVLALATKRLQARSPAAFERKRSEIFESMTSSTPFHATMLRVDCATSPARKQSARTKLRPERIERSSFRLEGGCLIH